MKIEKLKEIKDFCYKIMDFVILISPKEEAFIFEEVKRGISLGFEKRNEKGLKVVLKDIVEMCKALKISDYQNLNEILLKEFGKNLYDIENQNLKLIKAIIKQKKIKNEDEYRLAEARVNDIISEGGGENEEIMLLNNLLAQYHISNGS